MSSATRPADQEVRSRVRSIVVQVAPNPDGARDGEIRLVEDLEYHSLALLELGFTIEDEFGLPPINQAQVQDITTVSQVAELVLALLKAKED